MNLDISNAGYMIAVIILLLLFWSTNSLLICQLIGTLMILVQFGLIYYYGQKIARTQPG